MNNKPEKHSRRSIRLKEYDYAQPGAYFITICVQGRECLFGDVAEGEMQLTPQGKMIDAQWRGLKNRYPNIELDYFVIMPNHFHGIVVVARNSTGEARAGTRPAPTNTSPFIGEIVGAFKSLTTHEYIRKVKQDNWRTFNGRLWQRNYFEHIIRNEKELKLVREYLANNPLQWAFDRENPINKNTQETMETPWLV